ncbi:MAG: FISUMP domain-containing protein [Bacilli bacterium]|jgi:uncharacterized protein (TIGR02145 family)/prepilin-type N-terminal cleavage/methylation domain-containing protein
MKKQGFTLIELLAVIAILGIILAITVPSIVGLIEKTTREAFLLDAKMVIKSINNKLLEDNKFDISLLDEVNIEGELNISKDNYQEVIVTKNSQGKPYLKIIGKNKWAGLTACGTYNKMKVGKSNEIECEEIETSFVCGTPVLHGGYEYKTVLIGEQCWFKENLKYTGSGSNNCLDKDFSLGFACIKGAEGTCSDYCAWDWENEILYQWRAIFGSDNPRSIENNQDKIQGLCPVGWHLPTDYEWRVLEAYVDTDLLTKNPTELPWINNGWRGVDGGKHLKTIGFGLESTNSSGFSALPAGRFTLLGVVNHIGAYAEWWSSTPVETDAFRHIVSINLDGIYRSLDEQNLAFSVRCLLD